MRYHEITASELAALATGRGDGEIVRKLAAGQLSKRLLQLRLLVDAGTCLPAELAGFLGAGYELAIAVQERDPAAVTDVIKYPAVGGWLTTCLRELRAGRSQTASLRMHAGHLGAIAAVAAIRTGMPFEIRVPLVAGTVMLPTLGRASFGPGCRADEAVLRGDGGAVEIGVPGRTIKMPADPEADTPGWEGLRRLKVSSAAGRLTTVLDDIDSYRGRADLPVGGRMDAADVARWERLLHEAWDLLGTHHPWYAEGIGAGLASLVPLAAQSHRDGLSATMRDCYGACALSEPHDAESLAVTLVHEFQHAKLGALHDLDPLYVPGPDVRSYSPWRDDPRPLSGLLQGAYAYLAITDFWRTQRTPEVAGRFGQVEFAHFEFARWRTQTLSVLDDIAAAGRLTATGAALLSGMRQQLSIWNAEPVPAESADAARDAIADHKISWRLRNLRPDQAAVTLLARAWLAGQGSAVDGGEPSVVSSDRILARNARLELLCLRLREPSLFTSWREGRTQDVPIDLGRAEVAYAIGDKAAASENYRQIVGAEPDRHDAWAGLAVTGSWSESSTLVNKPELVYAVHSKIREIAAIPGPEPAELAGWLDTLT